MEGPDPTWPGWATLGLKLYSKEKGKPLRVAIVRFVCILGYSGYSVEHGLGWRGTD